MSNTPAPTVEREAVEGECPKCAANRLMRYPVLSEGGWFMTVTCQDCLHDVQREPWHLLGPIALTSQGLVP